MGRVLSILAAVALLLAGCGDDSTPQAEPPATQTSAETTGEASQEGDRPARERPEKPAGTTIIAGDSEFGEMLFGADDQAIYVFEQDPEGESACYDECAEAWPPVLTDGEPRADGDVEGSLLGTTERRDGELQVTYAGQPLYFYAHEAQGEVRCHNVNLNGGFWWVVGPDGDPLA